VKEQLHDEESFVLNNAVQTAGKVCEALLGIFNAEVLLLWTHI